MLLRLWVFPGMALAAFERWPDLENLYCTVGGGWRRRVGMQGDALRSIPLTQLLVAPSIDNTSCTRQCTALVTPINDPAHLAEALTINPWWVHCGFSGPCERAAPQAHLNAV